MMTVTVPSMWSLNSVGPTIELNSPPNAPPTDIVT